MRLFLDTEFNEDGRTIDLISIALVSETGQEFYRQNASANLRHANAFVQENVIPKLWSCPKAITGTRHMYGMCTDPTCVWRPKRRIADELRLWVAEQSLSSKPEFWGYYADYDWVVLCQLFGAMVDLPPGWPKHCTDLKQMADTFFPGIRLDRVVVPEVNEHNALSDARWNRRVFDWMISQEEVTQNLYARRQVTGSIDQKPEGLRGVEEEVRGLPGGEDLSGEDQQRSGERGPQENYEPTQAIAGDPRDQEEQAII